jgi:serine/threonine-protein kinase
MQDHAAATRQWQPQGATTLQRPVPPGGGMPRPPERRSSSWVMAALAGLGVLVVIVLGVALAMNNSDKNKPNNTNTTTAATVSMPSLKGLSDEDARAKLDELKLTKYRALSPSTDTDCDGKVFNQYPAANSQVTADTEITYQLCQPPAKVTVPENLVGGTQQNAEQALTAIGLVPDVKQVDNIKQTGTVLDVESQGKSVDPGTHITVKVSKGNQVPMPELTGKSLDVAQGILDNLGSFTVVPNQVPGDGSQPAGTVTKQNPLKGTPISNGDKITLTVVSDDTPSDGPSSGTTPPGGGNGGGGNGGIFNDSLGGAVSRKN